MNIFSKVFRPFQVRNTASISERETWNRAREERLVIAGNRCELCNSDKAPLHAHHRRYSGRAVAADITMLCKDCHAVFTAYKRDIDSENYRANQQEEMIAVERPEQKPVEFLPSRFGVEAKWFRRFAQLETPARREWRGDKRIYSTILAICQDLGMISRTPNGGAKWDDKYAQCDRYVSIVLLSHPQKAAHD